MQLERMIPREVGHRPAYMCFVPDEDYRFMILGVRDEAGRAHPRYADTTVPVFGDSALIPIAKKWEKPLKRTLEVRDELSEAEDSEINRRRRLANDAKILGIVRAHVTTRGIQESAPLSGSMHEVPMGTLLRDGKRGIGVKEGFFNELRMPSGEGNAIGPTKPPHSRATIVEATQEPEKDRSSVAGRIFSGLIERAKRIN